MRIPSLCLAVCALFFVSCAQPGTGSGPGSTEAAPNFSVQTFEGDNFELAAHKGTPVVINFWESW